LDEKKLIAGNGKIRGGYKCVCFTEAPLPALCESFANQIPASRYLPFGVMFDKPFVFAHGGLPVIYQPDDNFDKLDQSMRWRHVRYEPINSIPIDFTWEREWRIQCEEFCFTPNEAIIILPDYTWTNYMQEIYKKNREFQIQLYSSIFSDDIVAQYVEDFHWRIITLSDFYP
jgi:hypothetical protein